jgi:SET domain-containing protein
MRNATCLVERLEPAPIENSCPGIEERQSPIHGRGVYALASFRTGEFVAELLGERISAEESDRRAELLPADGHTFFFWVDDDLVLDCSRNGNSARYMNHHCEPNCESVVEGDRVFIYAIRPIKPGDELTYDYHLCWTGEEEQAEIDTYACRCEAATCRGTMLTPEPMDAEEV